MALVIYLDNTAGIPLYEQLYEKIKAEIVSGQMAYNSVLMPIRKMAEELKISRNTVDHAYQQLVCEGYLRSVQGGGYFVDYLEERFHTGDGAGKAQAAAILDVKAPPKLKYDFKYECKETSTFSWVKWRKYVLNAILEEECQGAVSYETNKGNYRLRQSLCQYLKNSRGVNATPEHIVVCAGTQYGIQIITSLLPEGNRTLAFEEPGYNGMIKVFKLAGYDVIPVPVETDNMDVEVLREKKCSLLYITPSHQFPTGIITSFSKRLELLEWAEENNAYIIENDYDNEFGYGEKKLPSLQSVDTAGRVIYVSTLTKVLSPSIRCAYFVLPDALLEKYNAMYNFFNASLPTYHQMALSDFINDGMLDKHVREMSVINRRKFEIIIDVFEEYANDAITMLGSPAGSHVLIKIPQCRDEESLIAHMKTKGIGLYGTREYWADKHNAPVNVFLFGYNSITVKNLERACMRFVKELLKYLDKHSTDTAHYAAVN
ncbi:MAG: PLP-dependent aminotransferase family protein [Oscillospiraceae bacterium]